MRVVSMVLFVTMAFGCVSCSVLNLIFPQITAVTGVRLSQTTLYLVAGGNDGLTGTLSATVLPSGVSNSHVTWSSSNPSAATVDGNGNVSSVHWGDAVITATTVDSGKTASCAVHVTKYFDPSSLTITTLAGSGVLGADSSTAVLSQPMGIASDGTNVYATDQFDNNLHQIAIASKNTLILAGSTVGSSGDAVDPTGTGIALFNVPFGVVSDGTFAYMTDGGNDKIRKITISSHVVSTLAGLGGAASVDGGSTTAQFNVPFGIVTDGTNLYVADSGGNCIRKVVLSTGYVTTLAGSATAGSLDGTGLSAQFSGPKGLSTDGKNLFVADETNNAIREVVISTGVVTTLANASSSVPVSLPMGVATDGVNVFFSERGGAVKKVVIASLVVTNLNITGITGAAFGIALDESHLFVSNSGGNSILQVQ